MPLSRVLSRGALALLLVLGCAQIFGIDEACVIGEDGCGEPVDSDDGDCASGDPSCEPDGGIDGLCSQYCTEISQKCTAYPQYDDTRPECTSLCRYFPRAQGESPTGNNLECRLARVSSASGERSDCFAAGRGGEDVCGSNCDAYCSLMQALCPTHFGEFAAGERLADDATECQTYCSRLFDRDDYDPALGGEDEFDEVTASIQCRLWHLGSAAIEVEQFGTFDNSHCEHAIGVSDCLPTPPPE